MEAFVGGQWRTISSAEAYVNGAWHNITNGEAYVNGAWRAIASFVQPLTLSVTSDGSSDSTYTQTPGPITGTPTGGLGPFTYAWVLVSSSNLTGITINTPSLASTTMTATVTASSPTVGIATLRCTVTDSLGSTATGTGTLSIERIPPSGTL
jgi:hypothetical protein